MTQMLQLSRPIPRGWLALAHVLAGAPARRRREFAQTEPGFFRSECFAEDLPAVSPPVMRAELLPPQRSTAWFVALLVAAPTATALLGAAVMMLDRAA